MLNDTAAMWPQGYTYGAPQAPALTRSIRLKEARIKRLERRLRKAKRGVARARLQRQVSILKKQLQQDKARLSVTVNIGRKGLSARKQRQAARQARREARQAARQARRAERAARRGGLAERRQAAKARRQAARAERKAQEEAVKEAAAFTSYTPPAESALYMPGAASDPAAIYSDETIPGYEAAQEAVSEQAIEALDLAVEEEKSPFRSPLVIGGLVLVLGAAIYAFTQGDEKKTGLIMPIPKITALLPMLSQLSSYLRMAADQHALFSDADGLASVIYEEMEGWNPKIKGITVLDEPTKLAAARFVAGLAISLCHGDVRESQETINA